MFSSRPEGGGNRLFGAVLDAATLDIVQSDPLSSHACAYRAYDKYITRAEKKESSEGGWEVGVDEMGNQQFGGSRLVSLALVG